jgi:hypothetical protein
MLQMLIPVAAQLLDKLIPDPQAKAQAQLELLRLQQSGELRTLEADLQMAIAQTDVNKAEAYSGDAFRGGWRPMAGWVCSLGLAYTFLIQPLLAWASIANGWPAPPKIDMDTLMGLLMGMLGLGGFRTFERIKGKA